MLYKKMLGKIRNESGVCYNEIDQTKKALSITSFAKNEAKDAVLSNKNSFMISLYLLYADLKALIKNKNIDIDDDLLLDLNNLKDMLKEDLNYLRYASYETVLKLRTLDLEIKSNAENLTKEDIISVINILKLICNIEIENAKFDKESFNTLFENYNDNESSFLRISRKAVVSNNIRNDIIYSAFHIGEKVLDGVSKVLK